MKNIVILTGQFGMGHCSAASAIQQEIEAGCADVQVTIIDIITYIMPKTSKNIYSMFNLFASKWPYLYNTINKTAERYSSVPFKNMFIKKLDCLMQKYSPDLIISTFPMASQYISVYKQLRNSAIPLYTYITDISTHEEWIAENTDLYFVGAEEVKYGLMEKGIPSKKIRVSGIPVKQEFKQISHEQKAEQKSEILVMGGGLGLIPFEQDLFQKLNQEPSVHVTVITGANFKLYEKLKNSYSNFTIIGYTDRVYDYMKKADLVLTKAGGITTFEAIYCEVPLYIVTPFLAQERKNAAYIEAQQIGKIIWKKQNGMEEDLLQLVQNKKNISHMKENMVKLKNRIHNVSVITDINKKKGACLCGG